MVIDHREHSRIERGIVILLGVEKGDVSADVPPFAQRIANLRMFADDAGKMNKSALEVHAQLLVVSQFTLLGDCRKGRRPSFDDAALPDVARGLYEEFVGELRSLGLEVATGVFQAMMDVELTNDGPVTFILDSRKR